MKKIIFTILLCLFSLFQYKAQACAPFTTNQIIVWEYNWLLDNKVPGREWDFQFIDLENHYKPFAWNNTELWKYYFVDNNRINLSKYNKWDLVITISSYDDWLNDEYFTVYEMWKISCNSNNEISIINREWKVKEFWKKIWTCWEVPENILSEKDVLAKINNINNICANTKIISNKIDSQLNASSTINEDEIASSNFSDRVVEKNSNKSLLNINSNYYLYFGLLLIITLTTFVYIKTKKWWKK